VESRDAPAAPSAGRPAAERAGADELIEAQYQDRPQLRAVLDMVLAALPGLGPVTVQALFLAWGSLPGQPAPTWSAMSSGSGPFRR